jgi:hypothetical protein
MHLNVLWRVSLCLFSEMDNRNTKYVAVFTIQNMCVLEDGADQSTNARKTPTAQSVSGPMSNNFCIRGPCCRLRFLQTSFIQVQNEYSDFYSRWQREFPRHTRPALRPTQVPVELVPVLFPGRYSGSVVALTPNPTSAKVKKK